MNPIEPTYRPHNPGHDYYSPGIYLITLVVTGRERLLSALNMDERKPDVVLTALGTAVMDEWESTATIQASKGRRIKLHAAVCMPDHFHGVIEVQERMDVSLGDVICGFKTACTQAWRRITGTMVQPCTVAPNGMDVTDSNDPFTATTGFKEPCMAPPKDLHHMSKRQRREYYDALIAGGHRTEAPLFDDNYDDTICIDERHKAAMIHYVHDNPRRAIIRRLRPQFMERRLHIHIAGRDKVGKVITRDYAAFGNLFLLRWARKVQVFCHRKARFGMLTDAERHAFGIGYTASAEVQTQVPYEQTEAYREECRTWKRMVMEGQTVIVTPGISMGERIIKDRCIECGYPLIHLQKEPITRLWKPEQSRFCACCRGSLLILAPWAPDELGEVTSSDGHPVPSNTDYSIFHNLNTLAEEICLFEGEAFIVAN